MKENEDFLALYDLVKNGKSDDKPGALALKIDKHLVDHPKVWRYILDLSSIVANNIAEYASGDDAATKAAMMVAWRGNIAELVDEHTTPLERILIDQVATTWLHLQVMTYKAEGTIPSGITFNQADHWEKRVNAAQRRHLRAVETLARVRKIERTRPLQVNIAQQQVNVTS